MMKTKIGYMVLALTTVGACTSVPSSQLVAAREAYKASAAGLTATLTPTELYEAKKSLDQANKEFEEHGDSVASRDYAYIAQRRVELANAKARTEVDRQKIEEAGKAAIQLKDNDARRTRTALMDAKQQLKDQMMDNRQQGRDLDASQAQLEFQKEGRLSAESKLAGAMRDLTAIAAVREEARGVVITLSGSVLFTSNNYALLNTAKTKLDQVAEALKAQDADKRMSVEGHTDSRGSDAINKPLSLNRAIAVRNYLVSRGVAGDRIEAVGMGSSHPITDNKTAENRANNRRVEIVIRGTKLTYN